MREKFHFSAIKNMVNVMVDIVVLGVFVADVTFRANRMPRVGETVLGRSFSIGPGGKGSNQAVAAARQGADVALITRIGRDDFARLAQATWKDAGVTSAAIVDDAAPTGAAAIMVDAESGDNAIIVTPGAAGKISAADLEGARDLIAGAKVFVTQLEQPISAARRGLEIARNAGVTTVLNPAPADTLPDDLLALCDYLTPNETEAEAMTGFRVVDEASAQKAAHALNARGVGCPLITMGAQGVYVFEHGMVPALSAGKVVETTGAGDAFNAGFCVGLANGLARLEAVRFGTAVAAISVTRPGAAASMPTRAEVEALLARN